jgi:protein gp37
LGTTVENQTEAEKRLPFLLTVPAVIRFLSCEPLLGPLNLWEWFRKEEFLPIDWIIAGGESGAGSRPMHPDWARSLLAQCQAYNVPFHFKQWGHWVPAEIMNLDLRVRVVEFDNDPAVEMVRLSKKLAGRVLEGTTWDEVPIIRPHAQT